MLIDVKLKEDWAARAGAQRDIRARVALRRKLNREPAPDEVAAAFVGNRNPFKDMKVEQIIEDYDKGLEVCDLLFPSLSNNWWCSKLTNPSVCSSS